MSVSGVLRATLLGAVFAQSIFGIARAVEPTAEQPLSNSALRVCEDERGNLKGGAMDVIVLLDNSKSLLNSDKDGERFDAVDGFLDNFNSITSRVRNFGLLTFGVAASEVIPFVRVQNNKDVAGIKADIRARVPNDYRQQEKFTNYIVALEAAKQMFRKNDPTGINCRILIWFTDGVFDTNDSVRADEIARDVRRLEDAVCRPGGLGDQFRDATINTFVVYLTPKEADSSRSRVSQDAMQVITGDIEPSFSAGGSVGRIPSANCKVGSHIGEVISVADSDRLIGFLTDLVPTADGAVPIFPEECPIAINEVSSFGLLDANLLDWISVVSWDGPVKVGALTVVLPSGEGGRLGDYLAIEGNGSRLVYLRPNDAGKSVLTAGWTLRLSSAGPVCLRLKPRSLEFEISRGEVVKSLDNLPPSLFADRLTYFVRQVEVSLAEALRNPGELAGRLSVESGEYLADPNRLPVAVYVNGAFRVAPECRITVLRDGEVPEAPIESSPCTVLPASNLPTNYDASTLLEQINACGLGEWRLLLEGRAVPAKGTLSADAAESSFSIATIGVPRNEKVICAPEDGGELRIFTSESQPASIEGTINLNLTKRGNPWLALAIAAAMTLVVAFLSLLLLRLLNVLTSKTIDGNHFFFYETTCELHADRIGRGALHLETSRSPLPGLVNAANYVADPDLLEQVVAERRNTSLKAGSLNFERQIPPLLKPFEVPRLRLATQGLATFWKANRQGDGLELLFASALALVTVSKDYSGEQSPIKARVVALIPRRGRGSGFQGAQDLIRRHGDELAALLWQKCKDETKPSSTSASHGTGASSGSAVSLELEPPPRPHGREPGQDRPPPEPPKPPR